MEVSLFHRYVDFIQYAIDPSLDNVPNTDGIDWRRLYMFAEKQAILGVVFEGVKRLSEQGIKPPFDVLMDWIAIAENIETRNIVIDKRCIEVQKLFAEAGFETCILKGQGNALMYPNPYSRTPGDIDIWVRPKTKGRCKKDDVRRTIEYIKGINPKGKVCYHHIDYGLYKGIEVEVHFRPSFMFNPIHNHRLQKWFNKMADGGWQMAELPDKGGRIPVPSVEFNIIFQLSHIYNHVLHEGIGLRQMIDYYYVLKRIEDPLRLPLYKGRNLEETLKYLGLWKFAGAVMYVMREVFALEPQCMIAPVDEKRGKIILSEILKGGNFGKYDADNIKANNRLRKNIQRIKRDFRMMQYFPSECLWEPVFRIYHFFWRMRYN